MYVDLSLTLEPMKNAIHDEYPEYVFGLNGTHKLPLVCFTQTIGHECV